MTYHIKKKKILPQNISTAIPCIRQRFSKDDGVHCKIVIVKRKSLVAKEVRLQILQIKSKYFFNK